MSNRGIYANYTLIYRELKGNFMLGQGSGSFVGFHVLELETVIFIYSQWLAA
jgi:hypothetical protein